jgi:hypothetical protein
MGATASLIEAKKLWVAYTPHRVKASQKDRAFKDMSHMGIIMRDEINRPIF